MATITISGFISIDGVVEAPGGEEFPYPNWSFSPDRGPEGEQYKVDETLAVSASLLGRRTYEGFAEAWPEMEGELADHLNAMPKYVFSSTLTDPTWPNTTVLRGSVVEEVPRLKHELDGEISVAGSISLAQELLAYDLVDELHLMQSPVVLGLGRTLWGRMPRMTTWDLAETRTFGEGVHLMVYRRARG